MNASPGKYNNLKVNREVDFGVYLDGGETGEILMPARYVPRGTKPGDIVNVFVYFDSEDRLIATTEKPKVQCGQCASLRCKSVTRHGAFLDWGLMKDLFVPFREQQIEMREGRDYVVYVFQDPVSGRIAGSSRLHKFLNKGIPDLEERDEVDLLIATKTPMGYTAVFNDSYTGLLYENEVFQPLRIGQRIKGYIQKLRPDGKTDLSLQLPGMVHVDEMAQKILDMLKAGGGYIGITDKSSPEDIYDRFGMSKKVWKKAVGTLYRERLIELTDNGIRLTSAD